jgi:hypothetical protein
MAIILSRGGSHGEESIELVRKGNACRALL